MTKKDRGNRPKRELTKRQLSRWQAQERRRRIILGAGTLAIIAVLAIMSAGWYASSYRPLHATAIVVNDAKFDMQYYIDWLKILGKGQQAQYMNLVADAAVQNIEQYELVREGAAKLGIKVSDDDVKQKLKSLGFPDNRAARDAATAQSLAEKVRDEYLAPKQVPDSVPQAHIMAMLLESEQQANTARVELEKGGSFADLAGLLSLDTVTKQKNGDLGWHPESVFDAMLNSKVPGEYAFGSAAGVLSQPRPDTDIAKQVGYWLIKLVTRQGTVADVNAMLLSSGQQASEVRARLVAGEGFADLAKQFSQLSTAKDDGGSLQGTNKGTIGTVFDGFVFNPDTAPGTLSQPLSDTAVTTRGGYWLVNVLEKSDSRPLDDNDKQTLKNQALNGWITSLVTDPNNKIDDSYLDSARKAWAVAQMTASPVRSG